MKNSRYCHICKSICHIVVILYYVSQLEKIVCYRTHDCIFLVTLFWNGCLKNKYVRLKIELNFSFAIKFL